MPSVAHKPVDREEREELVSLDKFLRMDFEEKTELVKGKIIQKGWTNFTHASLVIWLGRKLGEWADENNWGWITGGDSGVLTARNPDTARGADIACISYERYARVERKGKIIDVGPELIIEVISPSNTWNNVQAKIAEYFEIGTGEVWVISPERFSVTVYQPPGEESKTCEAGKYDSVASVQLAGFELSLDEMKTLILRAEGKEEEQ